MDRIFEKDSERFDNEVREQENEYRKHGLCPDCGRPTDNKSGVCDDCGLDY